MARIGFYAPLKSPHHPKPSGDRRLARLLMQALRQAGHDVVLMSEFRSFEGKGDPSAQTALAAQGQGEAREICRQQQQKPREQRIQLWLTYHLYHKAPDFLGAEVSAALGIPYVLIEASYAPKQSSGPWAMGLKHTANAISRADRIGCLNPKDIEQLAVLRGGERGLFPLAPFIDRSVFYPDDKAQQRADWAERFSVEREVPWLLSVGMLRPGDKFTSFQQSVDALLANAHLPWHWWVVGDGDALASLQQLVAPIADRVTFVGRAEDEALRGLMSAADLMIWPAVNEALGMVFLEAQACGLPVLAGHTPGVASVCDAKATQVVPQGNAFITALTALLQHPERRLAMVGQGVQEVPDVQSTADALSAQIDTLVNAP